MVNLKAAPAEPSAVITFPPSSAHKWILPNGLTIIVQEDHSAPVASVAIADVPIVVASTNPAVDGEKPRIWCR